MSLSKRATTRITKLVEFMANQPRSANKHFNMGHRVGKFIEPGDLRTCGTTACALGWAAIVPSFRKAGLRVEAVAIDGHCQGKNNSERAMDFFDVSLDQFSDLFSAGNDDSTPKQWAKRIKRWLREQTSA